MTIRDSLIRNCSKINFPMKKQKLPKKSGSKMVPAFTWISRKSEKVLKQVAKLQGRGYAGHLRHVLQRHADDVASPSGKIDC